MNEKITNRVGWFASFMGVAMYFSYIDQIRLNISGQPGSLILPIVTVVNCMAWILYGAFKTKKDWPIIICNLPGIVLGTVSAVTALI